MQNGTLWGLQGLAAVGIGIIVSLSGCGPVIDDVSTQTPGKVCYTDGDCVADACCGEGHNAVHIDDGPDCRGITCNNTCPAGSIDCGCGLPVCKDQRCTVARTVSDQCPAQ